jgi:hypothetical protein
MKKESIAALLHIVLVAEISSLCARVVPMRIYSLALKGTLIVLVDRSGLISFGVSTGVYKV